MFLYMIKKYNDNTHIKGGFSSIHHTKITNLMTGQLNKLKGDIPKPEMKQGTIFELFMCRLPCIWTLKNNKSTLFCPSTKKTTKSLNF